MSADGTDDFLRPPNDNAYEADEVRTGPPLAYVAEKIRHALKAIHMLIHEIRQCMPHDELAAAPRVSSGEERLLVPVLYAFRSAVVGYLALNNLLALANDSNLDDRLLAYSRDEFREWLDRIDQAGSVTG